MKKGPLDGVIVLDLSRVLAGPFCTGILYNLGARVIKVENPKGGDDSRHVPPFVDGESVYFSTLNHGRESIALDIKNNAEDRKVLEKLIRRADVLLENFRPGVLARLGYDKEKLTALNARLIVASISGYGETGPESLRACYDLVAQGISGLMSVTGEAKRKPVKAGLELGDMSSGIFTAMGICAALFDRTRTSQGTYLDTSLIDCLVSFMYNPFSRYSTSKKVPEPAGSRHSSIAPFDVFQAQDKPIIICAANDRTFAKLCSALGKQELITDQRFIDNMQRISHVEELTVIINSILENKTVTAWLEIFNQAGVPAGPINHIGEVLEEPQIQFRNMIARFTDKDFMPDVRFPGNPLKFSNYPDTNQYPRGPKLNEHREAILQWLEQEKNN